MCRVLIVAPSLDLEKNVSGVSAVANFIIANNKECEYVHFQQGKSDGESGTFNRLLRLLRNYRAWEKLVNGNGTAEMDGNDNDNDNGNVNLNENENQNKNQNKNDNYQLSIVNRQLIKNGIHFLYLGRIEPNKGMDYLLEAMTELKEEGRAFTLHFAGIEQGKNGYIEKFQSLLGEQFVYEGIVSGVKKTDLFKRCQIFVLPSLYEGLPMSLLETMAYGLVPVVTNVGSISEYVKDGENGLLLKVKDSASIVKALKQLNNDKEHMQRMGEAARQTIITRLDPNKYVEELNRIYGDL